MSNKNNWAQLMIFVSTGISHLISKLSLISNENLLVPWAKMIKSSKEREWSQNKRWSHRKLSSDNLTLLKVSEEILICSPELSSRAYQSHHNRKNCIYNAEIYKQHNTQGHKVNNL